MTRITARRTIHQHHVTPNAEFRDRAGKLGGFGKFLPAGHESGRGDQALLMGLDDSAVDARGEAEIVSIDNEAAQEVSVAKGREWPGRV